MNKEEMKQYTSTKTVKAMPMTMGEAYERKLLKEGVRPSECETDKVKELEKIESKFKEGDVVVDRNGDIILVSKANDSRIISNAVLYTNGDFIVYSDAITYFVSDIRLASREERNKLFSALVREGYRYDEKRYRLIKQEFKPFDKVLIRDEDNQTWRVCLFSHYREDLSCPYVCVGCIAFKQCIPYEGNEYLLGTTDNN